MIPPRSAFDFTWFTDYGVVCNKILDAKTVWMDQHPRNYMYMYYYVHKFCNDYCRWEGNRYCFLRILPIIDGKGAAKGGKMMGKANTLSQKGKVEKLIKEYVNEKGDTKSWQRQPTP